MKSKFIYFRNLRTAPPENLPFYAGTSGHYTVNKSYIGGGGKQKPVVQFYWGISGEGLFFLHGKKYIIKPGHVCFYFPQERQYIRPESEPWEFRFMNFAGPLAEQTIKAFNIQQKPHNAGRCPGDLFDILGMEIRENSYYSQCQASAMVYQILAAAGVAPPPRSRQQRKPDDLSIQAVNLIRHAFANPETNIDSIAESLGVHRVTLARMCREKIGLSPKEYLTSLRMDKAQTLLRSTDLPIKEICRMSGFRDPNYFEKVFKKNSYSTPSEYRLQKHQTD